MIACGIKKILIVNPFGIGDVIFSFWMAEAIRRSSPGCIVDYVCNERTADLVALNPTIRKRFVFNRDRLRSLLKTDKLLFFREIWALLADIRKERYDVVFDLSMGREYAFFLMCSGVKTRIGFDYKGRGFFLSTRVKIDGFDGKPIRDYYGDLLEKWLAGASEGGVYPVLRAPDIPETLPDAGVLDRAPLIIMVPGGGRSWGKDATYKQWSPEQFARVAKVLSAKHGARIVLMGDTQERALCERVREYAGMPDAVVMAGESLGRVVQVMRKAQLLIGNDGGLLHLADLLEIPLVGIYGPVDERVYGPRPDGASRQVLAEKVSCRPCYRKFRFPQCRYEKRCLKNLSCERVSEAAERILVGAGAP